MAENILTMENIVKTYKMGDEQQTVLKGIDLQVDKGEFVAILGPSGSGKSTLMNIIGCLDTATSGTYHLHGRDVSALSESELARVRSKEIGFIFQSFQLLQRQDALQNVELPLIYAGMSGHERAARAQQMLERVGLKDKMHHFPNQLSGGQQQRVAIARALANNPTILLADEPTGALDRATGRQVMSLFHDLNDEGRTIIMITHDLGVVAQMCDEVIVMYAGSICEQGTADEIFYNPRHEYTKGLMRSIPTAENNGQRLEPITGTPIDLLNMPKGCPFAPRCEAAMKICLKEKPVRMLINDDHMATCWMNVKKGVEDGSITEEGGVPCV